MARKKQFGDVKQSGRVDAAEHIRQHGHRFPELHLRPEFRHLLVDIENSLSPSLKSIPDLQPGEHAYRVLDSFKGLIAVNSGWLKIYRDDADGREQVLSFVTKGEIAGLEGLGGTHTSNAVALCPTSGCLLNIKDIAVAGGSRPDVLQKLLELLGISINRQETFSGNHNIHSKFAAFLMDLLTRSEMDQDKPFSFTLPMTHREIASYLCIAPETLSRTITHLTKMGLLEGHGKRIRIMDVDRINIMAGDAIV